MNATSSKIALAALKALADEPWHALTLDSILKTAKIAPRDRPRLLKSKEYLIPLVVSYFDQKTKESLPKLSAESSIQDRLFDLIMTRLDCMAQHKKAVINLADVCRKSPELALKMIRAHKESAHVLCRTAQLEDAIFRSVLSPIILLGVYHFAFLAWEKDDSPDYSKTMAVLDHALKSCANHHFLT